MKPDEFYWVKYRGEWTIGSPDQSRKYWSFVGTDEIYLAAAIEEIGEKIERNQ